MMYLYIYLPTHILYLYFLNSSSCWSDNERLGQNTLAVMACALMMSFSGVVLEGGRGLAVVTKNWHGRSCGIRC